MKTVFAVAIASGIILPTPQLAEAQCMKWRAFLSTCDVWPGTPNCSSMSTFRWTQQRYYYSLRFTDSAQTACENSYYNHEYYTGPIKARILPEFPDFAECWIDYDGDNVVTLPTAQNPISPDGYQVQIPYTSVMREPECELVPNGKYANSVMGPATPTAGGSFSESIRNAILDENLANSPEWNEHLSDAPADPIQSPRSSRQTFPPYEDDPDADSPYKPTWAEGAQIDHIIPRKDIHGCPCGTNSPANAAVISAKHNNAMSNQMSHPGRQQLLLAYTSLGSMSEFPESPEELEEPEEAEDTEDLDDLGEDEAVAGEGCSIGSDAARGWPGLLVLAALGLRRRRRATAASLAK